MNNQTRKTTGRNEVRRGSTLVIVIALLGLLSFTGMMIFTFSAQERTASESFSNAQKETIVEEDDVISFAVEQLVQGAGENHIHSALYSPTRRHSLVSNLIGNDVHPFSGSGVHIIYEVNPNSVVTTPVPRVDLNRNGTANDEDGVPGTEPNTQGLLEFADSPAFRNGNAPRLTLTPEPDVPYTYPDNNHLFLAYKGFAIRNNGGGAIPQFEQVPVVIPSFFRPQYMKTTDTNGPGGSNVPTDLDWAADSEDTTALGARTRNFMARSMRPHVMHRVFNRTGQSVPRYITDAEAATAPINLSSGGFPFAPEDVVGGTATRGELGIWTGSAPNVIELDVDNDGDGIREGIWMDLDYPLQEITDSSNNVKLYTILHSMTVYDLDALVNVNTHGNLAFLGRGGTLSGIAATGALGTDMVSASNLGLGPNEVNPIWALRRDERNFNVAPVPGYSDHHFAVSSPTPTIPPYAPFPTSLASPDTLFYAHFGRIPTNSLEQANMEWIWLLSGRGDFPVAGNPDNVYPGRWGEAERLYNALRNGLEIVDLPRPGLPGNAQESISTGISFGGRGGYDDDQNSLEGEPIPVAGVVRPFGHPMDFQGTGRQTATDYPQFDPTAQVFTYSRTPAPNDRFGIDDPRNAIRVNAATTPGSSRWQGYLGYSVSSVLDTAFRRYMFGPNGTWENGTGDDLSINNFVDANFEDPLESIFFNELANRPVDQIFSPADAIALHVSQADLLKIKDDISLRLQELAPFAFAEDSPVRERFTTLSTALRYFALQSPFGGDQKPGLANVDDDLNGIVDDPRESLVPFDNSSSPIVGDVTDDSVRYWEFNTDTDGDGRFEFPPTFRDGNGLDPDGPPTTTVSPYSVDSTLTTPQDPFRPVVRRLLSMEIGERNLLLGQKPLSLNHLLDVERNSRTPAEGTPQFLAYLKQSGLRLRLLTEHPDASTTGVLTQNRVYTLANPAGTPVPTDFTVANETAVAFPPTDFASQEFWARRDRQKMCRDIFVMLYVTGGAEVAPVYGTPWTNPAVKDYTRNNNPDGASGAPACLYTHGQLRRMAQFAVNLVDRLDTDNVITRFEYDKNLGDGWNLDDDPYTNHPREQPTGGAPTTATTENGMYPEDTRDRGVVHGVEAQELAFSEVLGVKSAKFMTGPDHLATLHDDLVGRQHLFVELQNVQPTPVPLATTSTTNAATAIWRLVRYDRRNAANESYTTPSGYGYRTLCFLSSTDVIPADGKFTIASASDATVISSDFFVDHNLDGTFELIAPAFDPIGTLPTTATIKTDASAPELKPRCSLDLVHDDDVNASRFEFLNDLGTPVTSIGASRGFFLENIDTAGNQAFYFGHSAASRYGKLNPVNFPDLGGTEFGFDLVLQRRANPSMPSLASSGAQNSDGVDINPWVEVDRVSLVFQNFNIADGDTQVELEGSGRLLELRSAERAEPLDDVTRQEFAITPLPVDFVLNSIGTPINDATDRATDVNITTGIVTKPGSQDGTGVFQLTQSHPDRDYGTPAELLSLPLLDGMLLTQGFDRMRQSPFQQVNGSGTPDEDLICGAAAMFLMPDFPNVSPDTPQTSTARDNRWYRFLQFVEVPSRTHRVLGNYLAQNRLPGKVNINMIRHREVLAGLIDNPMFADAPPLLDKTPYYTGGSPDPGNQFLDAPFLTDSTPGSSGGPESDTWLRLVNDREGSPVASFDPVTAAQRAFWIPGTPNAVPFQLDSATADRQIDFDGGGPDRVEGGIDDMVLRRQRLDIDSDGDGIAGDGIAKKFDGTTPIPQQGATADASVAFNRQSFEIGSQPFHAVADYQGDGFVMGSGPEQRHQVLSKILNNTTTVSNSFIVYVTAGYFECYQDPATQLIRVGGRFDLDQNSDPTNDIQREVMIIDRSELFSAYDSQTGSLDWRKLVKHRVKIE